MQPTAETVWSRHTHRCVLPVAAEVRIIAPIGNHRGFGMSTTRTTVIAAIAALALSGTMVTSTAPADAHTYTNDGTVSAKEARKLFKETFKQKCLTVHEARHIAHGSGELSDTYSDEDYSYRYLTFHGTKKSRIHLLELTVDADGKMCVNSVTAYKR